MCGIAGFIQKNQDLPTLHQMMEKIQYRGPDGKGHWHKTFKQNAPPETASRGNAAEPPERGRSEGSNVQRDVAERSGAQLAERAGVKLAERLNEDWHIHLGHQRLSIIDVDGGAQPLGNDTGSLQITYNGEVYNFLELQNELKQYGYHFKTRTDTEVVLKLYEKENIQCLAKLNGMFAFAIWNQSAGELLLARDRSGIKPLYYAILPNPEHVRDGHATESHGIAFSSELTSLIAHPKVSKEISETSMISYFFSDYTYPPQSLLKNVYKLEPGHYLLWKNGKISNPVAYWNLELKEMPLKTAQSKNFEQELYHLLNNAVKKQLVASDVPVGVFLSGGIDSSAVAALAQQNSKIPLKTFSIGFENMHFDESKYARLVAKHIHSEHIEEILKEEILIEVLESALNQLDEPLADPSFIPTWLLSRLAARHVKVALGGDGGDELWAGYPTHLAHQVVTPLYLKLPFWFRKKIFEPLVPFLPVSNKYQPTAWRYQRFIERWDEDLFRRHLRWMSSADMKRLNQIFVNCEQLPSVLTKQYPFSKDRLNTILALDFLTYLPNSVLTKVDRASMAHSLEVRPPFLDNAVIDFAFSLPSSLKIKHRTSKFLLKKAVKNLLPPEIIHRKKQGFSIPLSLWIRGPLQNKLKEVLAVSPLWQLPYLSKENFIQWNKLHLEKKEDFSKPLWALLVLDHWIKKNKIL